MTIDLKRFHRQLKHILPRGHRLEALYPSYVGHYVVITRSVYGTRHFHTLVDSDNKYHLEALDLCSIVE